MVYNMVMKNFKQENIQTVMERYFIRSIDFADIFESFFVSAVTAILGIRLFLIITGYPQIGRGSLHIAHMLWGGLLMLISIILLLIFLSRSTRKLAAVVGGLGFGVFIDELGKFITMDNDYFYKPTFAILYIIFVVLYLTVYSLEKYWNLTPKEYLTNGIEFIKEAVIKDLDTEEKHEALSLLAEADQKDPITRSIQKLYLNLETINRKKPGLFSAVRERTRNMYFSLVKKSWFPRLINLFFIIRAFTGFFTIAYSAALIVIIIFSREITWYEAYGGRMEIISLFSSAVSGLFVIAGVMQMRRSRLSAYRFFKLSLFISIFLVQVFSFYQNQLNAFGRLMLDILVLSGLNYMIAQEQTAGNS